MTLTMNDGTTAATMTTIIQPETLESMTTIMEMDISEPSSPMNPFNIWMGR